MTQTDIDRIKAYCEKATPGPWFVGTMNDALFVINEPPRPAPTDTINTALKTRVIAKPGEPHSEGWTREEYDGNAHFIANARTDLPLLLQQVEQLRAVAQKEHHHTCVHHTDEERIKAGCPVCQLKVVEQLRQEREELLKDKERLEFAIINPGKFMDARTGAHMVYWKAEDILEETRYKLDAALHPTTKPA